MLSYGECPECGASCQPPDFPDGDGLEFCCCCDCRIMWDIVHNKSNSGAETWERVFPVCNVMTFDEAGYIPFECKTEENQS